MAGIYTRTLRRMGHGRWFAIMIKHAGCRLERALYRASRGPLTLAGRAMPTMLLTTRGRKTGKDRTVPVFFVRDGDRVIAACENFGLRATSSCPLNLRAHPYATIQIGGTVALRHRARSAPQIFRHEVQDGRRGRRQLLDRASNKLAFVPILLDQLSAQVRSCRKSCAQ